MTDTYQTSDEIMRFSNVTITYGGKEAVSDLTCSLHAGEILGIVGESGSGKSTLLRAAMGLLGDDGDISSGQICYRNTSLSDLSQKERRRLSGAKIGMVFQDAGASFCPIRTVGDQMYEGVVAHKKTARGIFEKDAMELFDRIGLGDGRRILNSYPFELSGGMQQRVAIAAAMLLHPSVLLADEPTSALDVAVQKQVVGELAMLREDYHTAIIIVTHNIGVIGVMADKVLVMRHGRMVEYGDTEQVLNAPREAYTKKLMAAVPRLRK